MKLLVISDDFWHPAEVVEMGMSSLNDRYDITYIRCARDILTPEYLAKFPAVTRDLSMVVPKDVHHADVEAMIRQRGGKILESVALFDLYEGEQIKEGFKSMAYSLAFRAPDRTLTDEDVNASMKKILNGLEGMGIELRA